MFGIGEVASLVETVVKRIWPDATESEKEKYKALAGEIEAELKVKLGQLEINKTEAAHSSVFVAGPRAFIMWVCGAGLAYAVLLEPLMKFVATVLFGYQGPYPTIEITSIMKIMIGLLGIG